MPKTRQRNEFIWSILFILPALSLFLLFSYYPMISSFYYSVTDFNGMSKDFNFIAFDNFTTMLTDTSVKSAISNTIKFAVFTTLIANFLNLLLSLALDSAIRFKNYIRVAFYIPCLLSPVLVSAIFGNILQYKGLLNTLFIELGLENMVVDYFGNVHIALPMLMVLNSWQWAGYGAVIYLAGLQTIPGEYLEAAKIDGANGFRVFFNIKLPLLMPSITIMTFISLTGGLKIFELPYTLTKGGPLNATETISMIIYKIGFGYSKMGYATAISIAFFLIIAILSIAQISFTRRKEISL